MPRLGEEVGLAGGIREWLKSGNFIPESDGNSSLVLSRVPTADYARAMASDFERFSLSSLETYIVATSENREFGAASWPFLKFYYSSFFAAHALLRARGSGVVNIERPQSDYINTILTTYSKDAPRMAPGTYFLNYLSGADLGSGEISVQLSPSPSKKGVHEAFWRIFATYIVEEAERAIKEEAADATTFLSYATNLKEAVLDGGGEASWLSMVRNKINYQHGYETWMPFRKGSEAKVISTAAKTSPLTSPCLDIKKSKKPLEAFLNISCYISNLNIGVSDRISKRSTGGKTFGQKWRRLNEQLKL
ncbi:hypothetical protein CLV77_0204 [Brevirhabdus pacifica]|nr:hypothetical protein CLV77_0204 [Brevirhabdus pacifica]